MAERVFQILGLVFASLALGIGAYMALLALGDGIARYTLTGDEARLFSDRACAQTAGCRVLRIGAGYDWRNARRRIIYRLEAAPGGMGKDEVARFLSHIASQETGVLGWTLNTESVLDMRVVHPSAPSIKRKGKGG